MCHTSLLILSACQDGGRDPGEQPAIVHRHPGATGGEQLGDRAPIRSIRRSRAPRWQRDPSSSLSLRAL
jgi:hypothetical protein